MAWFWLGARLAGQSEGVWNMRTKGVKGLDGEPLGLLEIGLMNVPLVGEAIQPVHAVHAVHDCYTGKSGKGERSELKDMEEGSTHYYN
jgi:hypothetical protein